MSGNRSELATLAGAVTGVGKGPAEAERPKFRPAPLVRYRDLAKLRYDYPLVLARDDTGAAAVRTLAGIVDALLREIAPRGTEGEQLRQHVLKLEQEIRALAAAGTAGTLSQVWELAEGNLLAGTEAAVKSKLKDDLTRARGALAFDGAVIDCNAGTPVELLSYLWRALQSEKACRFLDRIERLIQGLSDVLKVEFMKSAEARTPERLKRSIGSGYVDAFDFETMSRVLAASSRHDPLPERRRQRINSALSILGSQRFFAPRSERAKATGTNELHSFVFGNCTGALDAFRKRLPEMAELVKAAAIAELEIQHRYRESQHDPVFARFDENSLTLHDLALFPSYLVCIRNGNHHAVEQAKLFEVLSSGLSMKVLVVNDDILGDPPVGAEKFSFGRRGLQIANMALGLNDVYVLQASSSHLYQMRNRILSGLAYDGPALFSLFSDACEKTPGIPPYLMTAAAMESRTFPAFAYDPAAGGDWASRFCISDNPQPDADWPIYPLCYEDKDLQRIREDVAFTFVDFVACDKRYARCFEAAPRTRWKDGMIPVAEFLELGSDESAGKVPYIQPVDDNNVLQRFVVIDELILAARRCREGWHSLQELGGINNSHARRLLDRERENREQKQEAELHALRGQPEPGAPIPSGGQHAEARQEPVHVEAGELAEAPPGEPYIETPRCTSCDECTRINNRLFAYDENKQAYIVDANAGTYRQLVEAAEACQVCIIHPGKPKNPKEPNLDELIKRAAPFN